MATLGFSKLRGTYSNVGSAAAIALVLTESVQHRDSSKDWPYIRDISQVLYDLRRRGFRFRDLGLRPIPGGYYSEDVETFVGQLLSMGYATQRSPIRLEKKGEDLCNEIIRTEEQIRGEELGALKKAVGELLPAP
jgi:hypothetical protein